MSALGVLDSFVRSRRIPSARGEAAGGDWLDQDALLMAVAGILLAEGKDSQTTRQLLARLLRRGLLGEVLALLARTDPGAASLALQLAARLDPAAARTFRPGSGQPRCTSADEEAVLAEWLRLAAHAVDKLDAAHEDRHLRSRLALAWGRLSRIAAEGEAWLDDTDSRVRANAVESLWGRSDPQAVELLARKLNDPHHRVAANAAVGLYLAGRPESVSALASMARHDDHARRAAAVWAMGRTGDARFLPLLAELRRSKAVPVSLLRNIVLARERIRQVEELPRETVEIRLEKIPAKGEFRIMARLPGVTADNAAPLRPTDFALECNGQSVWDYRAWRSSLAGPDALALAVAGESAEDAAGRAAEIASEAGGAAPGLLRLALGYENRRPDTVRAGDILGLGHGSASAEGFAAEPAGWAAMILRAARRLSAHHDRPLFAAVVERGAPEWLGPALTASARDCAALGVHFTVLHEPAALEPPILEELRAAGCAAMPAPGGAFAAALRTLIEAPEEAWFIEAPTLRAEDVRAMKLFLRSGWLRGEAGAQRAS
ncbi:MAG: hypothetical protein KatS3mg005_3465 [Bryobacteraceae bacterium]|nr:MAG: hypothetical protein KatS3mg005_3465 [Bryobacteraceae bacterium]